MKQLEPLLCRLLVLVLCATCARKAPLHAEEVGEAIEVPTRIIESPGFIPKAPGLLQRWIMGGVACPGDLNGDGWQEFIVASGTYPGQIAAYSGKDGSVLWQAKPMVGKTAEHAGEKSYTLADFTLIADQNADGILDVFARNNGSDKEALIFSGKDGKRLARGQTGFITTPIRVQDYNGDGIQDMLFLKGVHGLRALSVKDFAEVMDRPKLLEFDEKHASILLPNLPDLNGDGVGEMLLAAGPQDKWQWLFLSGRDFSLIRQISVSRNWVLSPPKVVCAGDVNGDGTLDFILTENRGAAQDQDLSYLAAVSGIDGTRLWETAGDTLPYPHKRFAVDAKTKQKRDLPGDVGFGEPATIVTDLDGDGAPEIACTVTTVVGGKGAFAVALFSGKNGRHLITLALNRKHGALDGKQLLFVDVFGPDHKPLLAATGRKDDKTSIVALLEIPRLTGH